MDDLILHNSEVVDANVAHPVEQSSLELELARAKRLRTTQAVAVATTGFVAGVTATAIIARQVTSTSKPRKRKKHRSRKAQHELPILGTKSFLVDIHLLNRGRTN